MFKNKTLHVSVSNATLGKILRDGVRCICFFRMHRYQNWTELCVYTKISNCILSENHCSVLCHTRDMDSNKHRAREQTAQLQPTTSDSHPLHGHSGTSAGTSPRLVSTLCKQKHTHRHTQTASVQKSWTAFPNYRNTPLSLTKQLKVKQLFSCNKLSQFFFNWCERD